MLYELRWIDKHLNAKHGKEKARCNNVIIMMTLNNLKYCFSGSLTITEFVLLSLVILENSCILNRYVNEILNTIITEVNTEKYSNTKKLEEKLIQERLMTTLHNSGE